MPQFPFNQRAPHESESTVKVWFAHTAKLRSVRVTETSAVTLNKLAVQNEMYHASLEADYLALWKFIVREPSTDES